MLNSRINGSTRELPRLDAVLCVRRRMGITYTPTRLKPISKALLLSSTLAGVLLFACVSPASAAPECWKTLINDWYDGRIDNIYPVDCYQQADRKSTRLNSSHRCISYAVFCLKK